jgi:hypothetical protein
MKNISINEINLKTPPLGYDSIPKHRLFREKSKIYKRGEGGGVIHQNLKNPPTGKRNPKIPPSENDSCQKEY